MLYSLHEWQHAMLAPMNALRVAARDARAHERAREDPQGTLFAPVQSAHLPPVLQQYRRRGGPHAPAHQPVRETRLGHRPYVHRRRGNRGRAAGRGRPAVLQARALRAGGEARRSARSGRRAALGALRNAAARHGARPASGARGLDHRLGRRAHGAGHPRRVASRRLHRVRARLRAPSRQRPARDVGVPADRARARGALAHGGRRRAGEAEDHDDDGRPDRRAPQPHGATTSR